jgi:hypothetical protein
MNLSGIMPRYSILELDSRTSATSLHSTHRGEAHGCDG